MWGRPVTSASQRVDILAVAFIVGSTFQEFTMGKAIQTQAFQ
jgi:hypothetical protein